MNNCDFLIVGAGLSGSTIAHLLKQKYKNKNVCVIDKRNHIAGNCYDYIDEDTQIRVSKYGAHLFHTNSEKVWDFINNENKTDNKSDNKNGNEWIRWDHHVYANLSQSNLVNLPININTINQIFYTNLMCEDEMRNFLNDKIIKFDNPQNSEESCLNRVGEKIYHTIFHDYTLKQWNKSPKELDKSILDRIPIRYNFDNRYFTDKYQVLPRNGYTKFVEKLLDGCDVKLNTDYFDIKHTINPEIPIIFTGPIDRFFNESGLPKLEYRSLRFETQKIFNINGFFQQNSVINFPSKSVDFTRIIEYKHFLNQISPHTIIFREFSCDVDEKNGFEPYYPVINQKNIELFDKYKKLAENKKNVHFVGRLANFKYFNMDEAILNSINYFEKYF